MPRHANETPTDRIERASAALHQAGSAADLPAVDILAEIRTDLRQIRAEQVEIRLAMARGEARFRAIEDWQVRHDALHAERKGDLKAILLPAVGQLIWLAIAAGVGYIAATLKH